MLLLVFQVENERFGLEVSRVIEVIPMVTMKKIPNAPAFVPGLVNFRGTIAPVIDISMLFSGSPAKPMLSTRIMIVLYTDANKMLHIIGLLAEHVIETLAVKDEDFRSPGIETKDTKYLGKVMIDDKGMLQFVNVDELLPESVQELLLS